MQARMHDLKGQPTVEITSRTYPADPNKSVDFEFTTTKIKVILSDGEEMELDIFHRDQHLMIDDLREVPEVSETPAFLRRQAGEGEG